MKYYNLPGYIRKTQHYLHLYLQGWASTAGNPNGCPHGRSCVCQRPLLQMNPQIPNPWPCVYANSFAMAENATILEHTADLEELPAEVSQYAPRLLEVFAEAQTPQLFLEMGGKTMIKKPTIKDNLICQLPQLIQITKGEDKLSVKVPYEPDVMFYFVAARLGGVWDEQTQKWYFDLCHENHVKNLCFYVYGTDGLPVPTMTVRVTFHPVRNFKTDQINMLGYPIARRTESGLWELTEYAAVQVRGIPLLTSTSIRTKEQKLLLSLAGVPLIIRNVSLVFKDRLQLLERQFKCKIEILESDLIH